MDVDWQKVFNLGAEKLGASLGTALGNAIGGPVGAALAGAILGDGNPNEDLQKIESRLEEIEKKLDALADYVVNQLPAIIFNQSLRANLEVEKGKFVAMRTAVTAALSQFRSDPTSEVLELQLANATSALLAQGLFLTSQGAPFLGFAVSTMTAATAAYVQLVQRNVAYGPGLATWSDAFLKATDPLISEIGNQSLVYQRSGFVSELARCKHIVDQFPDGVPPVLIYVSRAMDFVFDGKAYPGYVYGAEAAIIHKKQNNRFTGEIVKKFPSIAAGLHFEYRVPDERLSEIAAKIKLDPKPIIVDWFPPARELTPARYPDVLLRELIDRYSDAHSRVEALPERIDSADNILFEIANMRDAARLYCAQDKSAEERLIVAKSLKFRMRP